MAKKKTAPSAARRPRQRKSELAAPPIDTATVAGTEPVETAAGHSTRSGGATAAIEPTPDEIAEAAYHRYLSRGGSDGRDFDDWLEAERELRSRANSKSQ